MKKILLITACILLMAAYAFAEGTVVQSGNSYDTQDPKKMKTATFTITSDAGSVPNTAFLKPNDIYGYYLLSVETYSATDDAYVVLIGTANTNLFTYTTTAATSGHIQNADDRWPVYSTLYIDVTGLATAESCTVIVTFVR
jgi:hypothetical protein